ncbi:MAG: LamG-like jellyroll fold domain-containing protein [Candidatus Micrarchaeaceae archaeon]
MNKAQSAMEYLMTYGWAILIIAVVLGALFSLGVFNPMSFAPKASPGSCQVFRPNGPGTTSFINLEGVCNGEMPQYVMKLSGQPPSTVIYTKALPAYTNVTISAWIYVMPGGPGPYGSTASSGDCGPIWGPAGSSSFWAEWDACSCPGINSCTVMGGLNLPVNQWSMLVFEMQGNVGNITEYNFNASGVFISKGSYGKAMTTNPYNWTIGSYDNWGDGDLYGDISNVQLYNTILSANQLSYLYQEGIGGAPIALQNLIAWWPLNGNANDYSGNGNNAYMVGNVAFVSNWWNGYSAP